jgi:hypothetical protein
LIDFDSCRHVGESILETGAKRTPQWHDLAVEDSTEENDSAAFEELKTWLTESAESFRFRCWAILLVWSVTVDKTMEFDRTNRYVANVPITSALLDSK